MADRVTLELEGLMLERLLNRALADGACFGHVVRLTRKRISVASDPGSARILRNLAEKYHIDCHMVQLGGLSALVDRIKRRATIAAAFAVAAIISYMYLSHVWIVDVQLLRGDSLPAGTQDALINAGLQKGEFWGNIDTGSAALTLNALEGCAHASVRREGVAVVAEIACEEPAPGLYEMELSRDLVALCDGVVSSVNVKSGTAMVKPGDTVKKGQVLISGYERASGEEFSELAALGSVTARVWQTGEAEAGIRDAEKRYTGRESADVSVGTPWISVPLVAGETYENCDTYISREKIGGLFVPLYVERVVRREYELVYVEHDVAELKLTLENKSFADAQLLAAENAPENAEIIDKWTDFSMIESEEIIHARTVIELEAEIAVTRGYLEGY